MFTDSFSKKSVDELAYYSDKMMPIGGLQKRILNSFRLTDEYRRLYCEYLFADNPDRESIQFAKKSIKKWLHVDDSDAEEYRELICDLLYTRFVLGYYNFEYFLYGLQDKSNTERLEFLPDMQQNNYYRLLNDQKSYNGVLDDKFKSFNLFKPFYKRDAVQVNSEDDFPEFKEFVRAHPTFIVKPDSSYGGKGIAHEKCDALTARSVFESLLKKHKSFLCEELIQPAEYMRKLYPGSVNTVRIVTYYNGTDEPAVLLPMLRCGLHGSVVDNYTSGGIIAEIDTETGIVCSDGVTKSGSRYAAHPDTGTVFNGFQIPYWDSLVALAKEMAKMIPQVRVVGWDITPSAEKGWQVLEGNAHPDIAIRQNCRKKGVRREFEKIVEWDKHSAKKK